MIIDIYNIYLCNQNWMSGPISCYNHRLWCKTNPSLVFYYNL